MKIVIPAGAPKFIYNYWLRKNGYVKCPNCKQTVYPGKYCDWCGAKLLKDQ